jgi:hypothetical protein
MHYKSHIVYEDFDLFFRLGRVVDILASIGFLSARSWLGWFAPCAIPSVLLFTAAHYVRGSLGGDHGEFRLVSYVDDVGVVGAGGGLGFLAGSKLHASCRIHSSPDEVRWDQ